MKIWSRFNCVTRAAPTSFIYSSFGKGPLPARFIGNFLEARGGTYLANQQYLVNYIKYHQVVLLSGLDFSHWKAWTLRTCWAPCCFCYGQSGFPYWLRWIILILQRFNAQIHPPNLVFQNDCCCWSGDAAGAGAGFGHRFCSRPTSKICRIAGVVYAMMTEGFLFESWSLWGEDHIQYVVSLQTGYLLQF